jgi:hypothetical protein
MGRTFFWWFANDNTGTRSQLKDERERRPGALTFQREGRSERPYLRRTSQESYVTWKGWNGSTTDDRRICETQEPYV